jgi:hypothetical protein
MYEIPATQDTGRRIMSSRPARAKIERPCLKSKIKKKTQRVEGIAQTIQYLASMCEVLALIPSIEKKRFVV